MLILTPEELRTLENLADDLIEATNDNTYWLGPVRDTALELRAKIDEWTDRGQPGTTDTRRS